MSPATLLGQQAGPLGTFLEWGLWEGLSSFRGTGTGVLKEVGLILTQPLPGCGTILAEYTLPHRRGVGNRLCGLVAPSGVTPNIQLLAQSKAASGHHTALPCDSCTPEWGSCTEPFTSLM